MLYKKSNWMTHIALEKPLNRPVSDEELESVKEIKLGTNKIEFKTEKNGELRCYSETLHNIELIDSMADFSAVKTLIVELWGPLPRSSKLPRVMLELGNLPNVEKLEIQIDSFDGNKPGFFETNGILSQWENIFSGLKELKLSGERTNGLWAQLTQDMDKLETLQIMGKISMENLLRKRLPQLRSLRVEAIDGLESIAQLTDHFPELKRIALVEKKNRFTGEAVQLGRVSSALTYLDLSAWRLEDPERIAESQIGHLCLRGCWWDPTVLKDCENLTALEMQSCILKKPMPDLEKLQNLNYLVMNDCQLTSMDFAAKLKNLQVLNMGENPIRLQQGELGQLPEKIAFVEDMPFLMEFVMDENEISKILDYPNYLSDKWRKANRDMLIPNADTEIG